jgi:rRNA-processing protein FCF1
VENGVTTRSAAPSSLLLMDACVLIDFIKSDQTVLKLFSEYLGPIYVISPVVEEVEEIGSALELERLGIIVLEPSLDDLYAAANTPGSISFQDRLCLLTAKRNGYTCVTNDVRLRKECEKDKIALIWGLELLIELFKKDGITAEDALEIALLIHEKNQKHITTKLVERFKTAIGL